MQTSVERSVANCAGATDEAAGTGEADSIGRTTWKPGADLKEEIMKRELQRGTSRTAKYWSAEVTRHSNALDLEPGVFRTGSPRRIATSLKASAESSKRRHGSPYQSAMSMLNFYLNRAGRKLPASQKRILERAKVELRRAFGR